MSKAVKKLFGISQSPFEVYESCDVDLETPKSSRQHIGGHVSSIDNRDFKVKSTITSFQDVKKINCSWSHWFLSQHNHQVNTQTITTISSETPPICKLNCNEPLAPMKPRKAINKSELRPKKLIFKDREDCDSDITNLLIPITLKQNIVLKNNDQSTNEECIDEREQKQPTGRSRSLRLNDDKENCIENLWIKNEETIKQKQRKPSKERIELKHLRI